MSVINKMLRDLDSQNELDLSPGPVLALRSDLANGTLHVPNATGIIRLLSTSRWMVWPSILLLCSLAGGWWYFYKSETFSRPADQPQRVLSPKNLSPLLSVLPLAKPLAVVSPPLAVVVAPLPVMRAKLGLERADISLKMDSNFKWKPLSNMPNRPASLPAAARAALQSPVQSALEAGAVPRRLPALELLSQAQNLWRLGSRAAAMELLREALALAELDNGALPGKGPVLASLARELARMQLAEGQVKEALAMLTRLEPALSDVAEVWALRGNSEQRLGLYEESAAAYLHALKLRPNEPRWMLATAVSLAAQGHIAAATDLAEKAHAAGVLSPEVAAYLKQLGVNFQDH